MKNILKVVFVIMGTLIGAGFASGREIYLFFNQYGYYGILGLSIASLIISILIYLVLKKAKENNIENYTSFLKYINSKHKKINSYFLILVNSFFFLSFLVMVAGFSAYMKQAYEISPLVSSSIFVLLCYFVFQKNLKGIMKINEYLVPFLLLFIFYLSVKNIPYLIESRLATSLIETKQQGFLWSSFLYASYNSILLIPILVNVKSYCNTSKDIQTIALLCGISIMVLAFGLYGLLLKGQFFIQNLEMPLLEISKEFGKIFSYLYGFIMIVSIFTSAIAAGYSFLRNVSKTEKKYHRNLLFMSIIGIFLSHIGFSKLVQILYPLFGMLGFIQILVLFKNTLEKNTKN